jgi:hypothetical protein
MIKMDKNKKTGSRFFSNNDCCIKCRHSGLDPEMVGEDLVVMTKLAETRITMIVVTH